MSTTDPGALEGLTVERVPLHELVQDPQNPKTHSERNYRAIQASLRDHGQVAPLVVQASTNVIIAGNATALSMAAEGMTHADVVLLDVDDAERRRLAVRLNRTSELGGWDAEVVADVLAEWGDDYGELWDAGEAAELFEVEGGGEGGGEGGDRYEHKIVAPVYEPKGTEPPLDSLADSTRTAELIAAIDEADIDPGVAAFLRRAAERHTAFHFARIAEFYCHASPEVQALMEDSGLVIIDFEAAVENGFVHLTSRLGKLADVELEAARREADA